MKKIKFTAIILVFALFAPHAALAAEYAQVSSPADGIIQADAIATVAAATSASLSFDAAAVILVERDTGRVLYEKNAHAPRAIASITKIMTMILVAEALESGKIGVNDSVTVSEHAYSMGGSQIWLEPGETMTVDELMRSVAIVSANDSAVALAEYVSGSEPEFVALMNRRAAELGMTDTVFKNSNGLDEAGHLSTAYDVSIMSRELLKHDLLREYVTIWTDELRGGETYLASTNKMLRNFTGTTGIKTGTTDDAGVCVSASAVRDGMELIAVVLGSSSSATRFDAAKVLLTYGFSNYEIASVEVVEPEPVGISLGIADYCEVEWEIPETVVVEKGRGADVHCTVNIESALDAPVLCGQRVGEISVFCGEELIGTYPVTAACDVAKIDLPIGLRMLIESLSKL